MAYFFLVERGPRPGLQLAVPEGKSLAVGRGASVDLPLPAEDRDIDPRHVELFAGGGSVRVRLLPNCGPVRVNGAAISGDTELFSGDSLLLGRTTMRLFSDDRTSQLNLEDEIEAEPLSVRDIVESIRALRSEPRPVAPRILPAAAAPVEQAALVELEREVLHCTGCGKSGIEPPRPDLWDATWLCATCAKERRQSLLGMPSRIGQFDVLRPLGHGGMGAVYEGIARDTGLHVAIKVLHPARGTSEKIIQRFAREQQIGKALRHPNIVCCYDVGTWEGSLFIASEYVSGGDALSIASQNSSIQQVLWLGADLFRALGYGHDLGIVHRDVKPANLLLCRVGPDATLRGKLSDFGLAKGRGTAITASNEAGGSLLTTSPEQIADFGNMGPNGDVYAGAATIFWLLTGDTPLVLPCPSGKASFEQKISAILATQRKSLREVRPDVPEQVASLIDDLVAHDPSIRNKMHAREVAVALNAIGARIARRVSKLRAGPTATAASSIFPGARPDEVTAGHFKEALQTVEFCIRMLERAVERAARDVREAVASDDAERIDRAVSGHEAVQADLEQALLRWEKIVEAAG